MAERRKSKYPEFRPEDIAAAGADTPQYYSSAIFNAPQGGFDPASPPQKSSTLNPPAPSLTRQRSNSQIVPNSAGFYPPPGTAPGYNKGATGPMPPPGPGGPPPSGGPSLLASAIGGSQGPPPPPGPGGYYPGSHGGTPMGYGSGGGYYGGPSWGPGYGPGSPAGSMGGYGSPMGGSAGADSPMGYNVGGHPGYGQATPGGYGGSQFKPPARSLTKDELEEKAESAFFFYDRDKSCLLYTSPSPRDGLLSRMPSSA
eukprot:TRINITY_DN11687_c0_g1_i3.p1 TRINITY_DN11687_c0_g1~~TRINITY_DN11687_c0_g1_i3.p1  ORF type:complete len:256 (-),score=30.54 TRINITY_DN11687_c0_g1_i3:11-778(-)